MVMTVLGDFEFNPTGGTKQIRTSQALTGFTLDVDATVTGEIVTGAPD